VSGTVFLLSPASCAGRRAQLLFSGRGAFPLAERLHAGEAVPLAEVFSFLSGLYFRGKHVYASAFATQPPHARGLSGTPGAPRATGALLAAGAPGVLVITTNCGLLPADTPVTLDDLRAFGGVPIDLAEPRYREPLLRDARALAGALPAGGRVVLLGSVATGKYVDLLLDVFGERLRFPREFVGRGDMSRGGLLLRCADAGTELEYVRIDGTPRRGTRPPKLEPRR
jgi:hypothetical protein